MPRSTIYHIRSYASIIAAFALLLVPSFSQSVGGGFEEANQWNGIGTGDRLGTSVSGAGDVNADGFDDLIVGALHTSPAGQVLDGSAYVYSGQNGSMLHQWNGSATGDYFGVSVSGAGDVNADGFDDLIVGASQASPGGLVLAGTAYVYSGQNGTILYQWNGAAAGDFFGQSVSGAGDVNGDGFDDLVVGAAAADSGFLPNTEAGSVFVYSGRNGAILHQWDGAAAYDFLGHSVSGAGDVNADGFDDLIVGAYGADPGSLAYTYTGSVYVYSGQTGAVLHQWDGASTGDYFGVSVSGAGDVNADGFDDLIVGAQGADPGGLSMAGSAYVYSGQTGAMLLQRDGAAAFDWLGGSVSGAGDVNADGFDDLIVGASLASPGGLGFAGAAYVYSGQDGAILHQWSGAASNDHFGQSVSGAGDINGDGFDDWIVGAPQTSPGGLISAGSAFAFGLNPYMSSNVSAISVASTTSLDFLLHFPVEAAGYPYKVLFSPTGPGLAHYGVDIPLPHNSYSRGSFIGNYPFSQTSNLHGTLDINGDANATIIFPAGAYSSYVGLTMTFAAIAIEPGLLPSHSSVAISVTLTP